jgi:hypothetical protein
LLGRRVLSKGMSLFCFSNIVRARCLKAFLALLSLLLSAPVAFPDPPSSEASKMFPASLVGFHQIEPVLQIVPPDKATLKSDYSARLSDLTKQSFPILVASTEYASADGERLRVAVTKYQNDSAAYSSLTWWRKYQRERGQVADTNVNNVGTASTLASNQSLAFFKGATFVTVDAENGKNSDQVIALARLFAATLDQGEGDIPVLVKHLPNSETAQHDAIYVATASQLASSILNQPILKEVNFEGGTEAVVANYGQAQLVIVEFTTPQFSVDNDQRILARIQELKSQGQAVPTAYRRVGNYSVFVFSAPDEKTANELIDQVKYQQVVQWLGDDPHLAERLQRYISQITAGVLTAVLKSSGLSLLLCLGLGGLIGTLLFRHRRAQKATLYSDAGGATRLNLDELTGAGNSHTLLEPGNQPESDSTQS